MPKKEPYGYTRKWCPSAVNAAYRMLARAEATAVSKPSTDTPAEIAVNHVVSYDSSGMNMDTPRATSEYTPSVDENANCSSTLHATRQTAQCSTRVHCLCCSNLRERAAACVPLLGTLATHVQQVLPLLKLHHRASSCTLR